MPRIASLLPSTTEIACALGFAADLVGRSHECELPPGCDALPVLTEPKLDPQAPIRMEAFMPPILGSKQMANFMVESWPALGTFLLGAYGAVVVGFALWHTVKPRHAASQAP